MPIYSTLCPGCAARDSVWRRVEARDFDLPVCACGQQVSRCLDAPAVQAEIPTYVSPATGELIGSRAQRREDLKKSGCIEWDPGMRTQIEKNRQSTIKTNMAKVEAGIDNIVRDMHVSRRL